MLVHSWANDYQALQPIDVPMSADTAVAVPELTRLCRELLGNDDKKKTAFETRRKELAEKHQARRAKWRADAEAKGSQKEISTAWLGLEIGEAVKREDWVLVNGTSNGWTRRLWDFTKPNQSLGGSGGAGLGYGPGASIGAALALKDSGKLAVAIQSDGDMGCFRQAREDFDTYLRLAPNAHDAEMVREQIATLEKQPRLLH